MFGGPRCLNFCGHPLREHRQPATDPDGGREHVQQFEIGCPRALQVVDAVQNALDHRQCLAGLLRFQLHANKGTNSH